MRVVNRPLAFILAAALLACSVVIICEVIGSAVHHSPLLVHWITWSAWARSTRWDAFAVRFWAAAAMIIGLVLVGLEVKPRRVTRLPLEGAGQATVATVSRRGLARMLREEATGVDGITGATVQVRRRRARVTAAARARGQAAASAMTEPLTQALDARLDGLGMRHVPRLTVRVVPGRR